MNLKKIKRHALLVQILFAIGLLSFGSHFAHSGNKMAASGCHAICDSLPPDTPGALTKSPNTVKEYCISLKAGEEADKLNISLLALDATAIGVCTVALGLTYKTQLAWEKVTAQEAKLGTKIGSLSSYLAGGIFVVPAPQMVALTTRANAIHASAMEKLAEIQKLVGLEHVEQSTIAQRAMIATLAAQILGAITSEHAMFELAQVGMVNAAMIYATNFVNDLILDIQLLKTLIYEASDMGTIAAKANTACVAADGISGIAELAGVGLMATGAVGDHLQSQESTVAGIGLGIGALGLIGMKTYQGLDLAKKKQALAGKYVFDPILKNPSDKMYFAAQKLKSGEWDPSGSWKEGLKLGQAGLNIAYLYNTADIVVLSIISAIRKHDLDENRERMHENCRSIENFQSENLTSIKSDSDKGTVTDQKIANSTDQNNASSSPDTTKNDSPGFKIGRSVNNISPLSPLKNSMSITNDDPNRRFSAATADWATESFKTSLGTSIEGTRLGLGSHLEVLKNYALSQDEVVSLVSAPTGWSAYLNTVLNKNASELDGNTKDELLSISESAAKNSEFWKQQFGFTTRTDLDLQTQSGLLTNKKSGELALKQKMTDDFLLDSNKKNRSLANTSDSSQTPDIWHIHTDQNLFQIVSTTIEKSVTNRNLMTSGDSSPSSHTHSTQK